jgi:hypothetical protein
MLDLVPPCHLGSGWASRSGGRRSHRRTVIPAVSTGRGRLVVVVHAPCRCATTTMLSRLVSPCSKAQVTRTSRLGTCCRRPRTAGDVAAFGDSPILAIRIGQRGRRRGDGHLVADAGVFEPGERAHVVMARVPVHVTRTVTRRGRVTGLLHPHRGVPLLRGVVRYIHRLIAGQADRGDVG